MLTPRTITVSVVTPSFNQARFLGETIESVLAQAGDFRLQYIVSDGGSTDGSVQILEKYEATLKDPSYPLRCKGIEFEWWSERDNGQSHGINKGFKRAKGSIVGWLNSDDLYRPNAIQKALLMFEKYPEISMLYSNVDFINTKSELMGPQNVPAFSKHRLLNHDNFIPQPTIFMRRTTFEKVGFLREDFHYAMDYELWCRIARSGLQIHKADEVFAAFRFHEESKTQTEMNSQNGNKFWPEVYQASRENGGKLLSKLHRDYLNYRYGPALAKYNLPKRLVRKTLKVARSKRRHLHD